MGVNFKERSLSPKPFWVAQGMSQLGLIQLGISIQVSRAHPLCLVLELFFFLGRVGRGAQARNKGGEVSAL